jgi:hypothetical protein
MSVSPNGDTQEVRKRDNLVTGERAGGEGGAKSDSGEKAWSSINHSKFTGPMVQLCPPEITYSPLTLYSDQFFRIYCKKTFISFTI